ncbi:MAG: LptF/LptG family permease, partial [Planctomycetota bacterium]
MRKPPVILHRLLAGDMVRLLVVTTIALVAVIAFAGALKPLADGRLTLGQALRFMGFLIVPMLQFALPFAAGFAATLAYHRFASDNEAMAASAAGLGHKSILTPALALGASLSLLLGVMSFEVIPPLLRDAQRVLVTDGTRVLASQLNQGESVRLRFGGSEAIDLFADRAYPAQAPAPGTPAYERGVDRVITLEGVLVVDARATERATYASAERIFLLLYDDEGTGETSVELILENTRATLDGAGGRGDSQRMFFQRMSLPSEIADDPKFLSWSQMAHAERNPRVMNKTDRNARVLEARLVER